MLCGSRNAFLNLELCREIGKCVPPNSPIKLHNILLLDYCRNSDSAACLTNSSTSREQTDWSRRRRGVPLNKTSNEPHAPREISNRGLVCPECVWSEMVRHPGSKLCVSRV